jgi:3-hydroxyacyl-[acyl-carrier-protein] dehydratase
MIAKLFCAMHANLAAQLAESGRYHRAHAVHGSFDVAGRFDLDQLLNGVDDLVLLLAKISELLSGSWKVHVSEKRDICDSGRARPIKYNRRAFENMTDSTQSTTEAPVSAEHIKLDIHDIMRILPHRYPFLLIDRVIDLTRKERIVAIKNVTINEPFFAGHFPGVPIMPGVLIIEAIAQAGGALLLTEIADRHEKIMVFTGIERARFRAPVVPGDQLRIEVEVKAWREGGGRNAVRMEGIAYVESRKVAEAIVTCQLVPKAAGTGPANSETAEAK